LLKTIDKIKPDAEGAEEKLFFSLAVERSAREKTLSPSGGLSLLLFGLPAP